MLRVSSRKLQASSISHSTSVQDFPGLPHHSFRRADAQFLEPGGAPVEVHFETEFGLCIFICMYIGVV